MKKQTLVDELGPFVAIPEKVIEMIPKIGSDAALLYSYFRYRTNRERGASWPNYETMQSDLGWGRHKISANIKILEDAKLMERKKRYGASTIYYLKIPPDMAVLIDESLSSAENALMEKNEDLQKCDNRAPVVPESRHSSAKTALKLDSINQININQIKKDSSPKNGDGNGRPAKDEYNRIRKHAEDKFYELTHCEPFSDSKTMNKRVWMPLIRICDLVQWREDDVVALLQATFNRMKGLTYDAPDQWEKTARSIVGEAKRGAYKPSYSFESEMQKFMDWSAREVQSGER